MVSRGHFGWSSPHVQPLTPVSETSETSEPPSPYHADGGPPPDNGDGEGLDDGADEDHEPPPAGLPFKCLFACSDRLDWALMAAAAPRPPPMGSRSSSTSTSSVGSSTRSMRASSLTTSSRRAPCLLYR